MRFVDGEQRDARAFEQIEQARREQAFGRDVEQVELAGHELAFDAQRGLGIERGIEAGRAHAGLCEGVDLVLHQRDQRRDHDAGAFAQQGRQLVAQRLAAAGGHQHQRVAAAGHVCHDGFLRAAEAVEAENPLQQFVRAIHAG